MWIAVAGLAAVVVGVVAWWLRRVPVAGDDSDLFEAQWTWGRRAGLTPEAEAAFMEGLRAYHDAGNAMEPAGERGVLTAYGPPRLISLHLLAEGFAALGDAALHDPQGTVAALMAAYADAERPGVLHLRPDWAAADDADGLDPAAFAAAVGEIVCPEGAEGLRLWPGGEGVGALQVSVLAAPPPPEPLKVAAAEDAAPQVNGRPVAVGLTTSPIEHPVVGDPGDGRANTLMLDLARVHDLYQEAREKQPDADPDALLREAVTGVIAAGGPGLTWMRPPTPEERRAVVAAAGSPELR